MFKRKNRVCSALPLNGCHLICTKDEKAAEKALKAVQFYFDARKVDYSHSLLTEVSMRNPTLQKASEELEKLVGDNTKTRYPKEKFFPKGPSDLYSKRDAEKALELATIIVETVKNILQ